MKVINTNKNVSFKSNRVRVVDIKNFDEVSSNLELVGLKDILKSALLSVEDGFELRTKVTGQDGCYDIFLNKKEQKLITKLYKAIENKENSLPHNKPLNEIMDKFRKKLKIREKIEKIIDNASDKPANMIEEASAKIVKIRNSSIN